MKKLYVLGFASLLSLAVSAQKKSTLKMNYRADEKTAAANAKTGSPIVTPNTVTGSIICTNGYVANSTMNLSFAINTSNTDGEYIDSLAITFPTGFTINSTNATPDFPTADAGGTAEPFNGVNGQTITWGTDVNNTDNYGGIWASPTQYFTINVTVGNLTGTQTLTFFAKGDGYPGTITPTPGTNGDLSGNITVNPAVPNDLMAIAAYIPNGCGLTNSETVELMMTNNGTAYQENFPVAYIANGGTPVVETFPDTLFPGDTIIYQFTTGLDMTTQGLYDMQVYTDLSGDANNNNDTALYSSTSVVSMFPPYSSSFENSPVTDLLGWTTYDADGSGATFALNATAHTGTQSIRAFEGNVNGASDDWAFSRCLDFDAANTYKVTFWRRLTTGYEGGLGVYTNTIQDPSGANAIYPVTSYTNTGVWAKDSATFTVSATGTYYLGFEAVNTNTAATIALRLDDINVLDLGVTTGISNNIQIATSVFPNPSTGLLFVNLANNNSRMEVYNMIGEIVYTKNNLNKGQNTIDLSNLSNGTYSVRIFSGNETAVRKINITK